MRKAARVIGPFGDQRSAVAIVVEANFMNLRGVFQAIEIRVYNR